MTHEMQHKAAWWEQFSFGARAACVAGHLEQHMRLVAKGAMGSFASGEAKSVIFS